MRSLILSFSLLAASAYAAPPLLEPVDANIVNTPYVVVTNGPLQPVPTAPLETTTPIQLALFALFQDGESNAGEGLGPKSFTTPADQSMLVEFVSCEAIRGVNEDHQFDISLIANFEFENTTSPDPLVQFVPGTVWESPGPFGDRAVASTDVHAYLNIPSPAPGAPAIGDTLRLQVQRNATTGTGGVTCTIGGKLFPRP